MEIKRFPPSRYQGPFGSLLCCMTSQASSEKPGLKVNNRFITSGRPTVVRKILIVDDTPSVIKEALQIFEASQAKVEVIAVDPKQSIPEQVWAQVGSDFPPDLILMDGKMYRPGPNRLEGQHGILLTRQLRNRGYQGYIVPNSNSDNELLIYNGADNFGNDGKITDDFPITIFVQE